MTRRPAFRAAEADDTQGAATRTHGSNPARLRHWEVATAIRAEIFAPSNHSAETHPSATAHPTPELLQLLELLVLLVLLWFAIRTAPCIVLF
jgi:hypothetical protein